MPGRGGVKRDGKMSRDPERAATQFFAGRVCLDFANTLDWRLTAQPQELIPDYAALLAWSGRRGVLLPAVIAKLQTRAKAEAAGVPAIMESALSLRARIWEIADALRDGRDADLSEINSMLQHL